jgi:rhodanese-related sulfurtransferase
MNFVRFRTPATRAARLAALAALVTLAAGCERSGAGLTISQQDLVERLEADPAPVVLDVRTAREYRAGHVPGAVNLEYRQIPSRLAELAALQDREIVVYCEVGPRAQAAQSMLLQAGFPKVRHLRGDMSGWRRSGLPVAR